MTRHLSAWTLDPDAQSTIFLKNNNKCVELKLELSLGSKHIAALAELVEYDGSATSGPPLQLLRLLSGCLRRLQICIQKCFVGCRVAFGHVVHPFEFV